MTCSFKVSGRENLPLFGGYIIVSNHASYIDPPVIAATIPRPIIFFARSTLFRNTLFAFLIRKLNAIPVKRGKGDREAMRNITDVAKDGGIVLIFPEGSRSDDGHLGSINPSFGLIPLKANVPIVPIYIRGSFQVWSRYQKYPRFSPLHVRIGEPIHVRDIVNRNTKVGDQARAISKETREALERLERETPC